MLLNIRELQSAHNGIKIARVILKIFAEWEIDPTEIGMSVSDNAYNNDTTIKEVVSQLFPS